jgi:hypothetical protein
MPSCVSLTPSVDFTSPVLFWYDRRFLFFPVKVPKVLNLSPKKKKKKKKNPQQSHHPLLLTIIVIIRRNGTSRLLILIKEAVLGDTW